LPRRAPDAAIAPAGILVALFFFFGFAGTGIAAITSRSAVHQCS
jgi:hypothetical protein